MSLFDRIVRQWMPLKGKKLLVEAARRNFMECTLHAMRDNGFTPEAVIDVGAYIGNWSALARRVFPAARVLMIEAQPSKRDKLQSLASRDTSLTFRSALLGAAPQPAVRFFDMETGSSIYSENSGAARKELSLPMRTLDDVAEDAGFAAMANMLLKLDVQGAELDVLRGGERTLANVAAVLAEVSLVEYNAGGPLAWDVIRFMHEHGFVIHELAGFRRIRRVMGQLDLVFVREDSPLRMTWRKEDRRGR